MKENQETRKVLPLTWSLSWMFTHMTEQMPWFQTRCKTRNVCMSWVSVWLHGRLGELKTHERDECVRVFGKTFLGDIIFPFWRLYSSCIFVVSLTHTHERERERERSVDAKCLFFGNGRSLSLEDTCSLSGAEPRRTSVSVQCKRRSLSKNGLWHALLSVEVTRRLCIFWMHSESVTWFFCAKRNTCASHVFSLLDQAPRAVWRHLKTSEAVLSMSLSILAIILLCTYLSRWRITRLASLMSNELAWELQSRLQVDVARDFGKESTSILLDIWCWVAHPCQ